MPTGYTADLHDGKDLTFEQFVWQCARGMGALVMMRDAPFDAPIPEQFEPDTHYYEDRIAEAESRLAWLTGLTEEGKVAAAAEEYEKHISRVRQMNAEREERGRRYNAMLEQVEKWEPPTPEHVRFKAFMVEQLTTSRDFDCSLIPEPPRLTAADWYAREMEAAYRKLYSNRDELKREIERTNERNDWIAALRDSLSARPA